MTTQARHARWFLAFLVALFAAVVGLFSAAPASGAPAAYTYDTTPYAYDAPLRSSTSHTLVGTPRGSPAGHGAVSQDTYGAVHGFGVAANTAGASDAPLVWPTNRGFHGNLGPNGNPGVTVLKPGTLVDRFGLDGGRFVAPNGTPIGARSLAPGTTETPYSVFEVANRLVVQRGLAEPWFGQPGMGTQYRLPATVTDLLDTGYLRRVN